LKENIMQVWKKLEFSHVVHSGEEVNLNSQFLGILPLLQDILNKENGHLTEYSKSGMFKEEEEEEEEEEDKPSPQQATVVTQQYIDYLTQRGGRLIYKELAKYGGHFIFIWEDGLVDFSVDNNYLSIRIISQNELFTRELKEYFDQQMVIPEKSGHIYAITQQGMSLGLSSLGNASIPLIEGNYTPKVMEDYKFIIKDLQAESPSGRITIMRGAPGTGKTHLIRAMLLAVPDAMFVLISPEIVIKLAGPELLPLLLAYRGNRAGPIILVLEDADRCLVKRDKNNMNSIQSLLNLGDGILGSMLDLRIIATTNAHELHMEEALIRKGRLSKMLEVGPLDLVTAQKRFKSLCPNKKLPDALAPPVKSRNKFEMTLADVYALARENGWLPKSRKIKKEGSDDPKFDF
jgi:hypothetical protein